MLLLLSILLCVSEIYGYTAFGRVPYKDGKCLYDGTWIKDGEDHFNIEQCSVARCTARVESSVVRIEEGHQTSEDKMLAEVHITGCPSEAVTVENGTLCYVNPTTGKYPECCGNGPLDCSKRK